MKHIWERNSDLSTYQCNKCGETSITAEIGDKTECLGSACRREWEELNEKTESDK
jgi:hypothetical protein